MSHSPTVSIIIPCYNHAKFLPARLESISKQTFTDFEIILLDDASSDNSQAVLQEFAAHDPRVTSTDYNLHNGGSVNDQWIKGVSLAKGNYIWIAESDDVASHEFLEVLLQQFQKSERICLAYCDSMVIDESGKILVRYDYKDERYLNRWQADFVLDGKTFIKEHMVFKNLIPNVSAVVFKKDALQASLIKNNLKYCADYYCYVRLLSQSNIAFVNTPLNFFRTHSRTTRWHSQTSHKAATIEKITILKEIKKLRIAGSAENIVKSYMRTFTYRNKFKDINKLYSELDERLGSSDRFALFGFNDICEYVLQDYSALIQFSVIFDNNKEKEGIQSHGVEVTKLSKTILNDIDVVVICSFAYKVEMRAALNESQFKGDVITL